MPTPRTPEEAITDVLQQLAVQMPANTDFLNNAGTVLVNSDDAVYQNGIYQAGVKIADLRWPVLLIQENGSITKRVHYRAWKVQPLHVVAYLMVPWQVGTLSFNTIWGNFGVDLRRMQANITDNPRLKDTNGVFHAERAYDLKVSNRRQGAIDEQTYAFPVLKRWLDMTFDLPAYTSAT
jgi:hypothetical protein